MKKLNLLVSLFLCSVMFFVFTSCDGDPQSPSSDQNTAPVGTAGLGKTVLVAEVVAFEATAEDPDNDSLTFSWSFSSVPSDSLLTNADITNANQLNASFTPDTGGDFVVQLSISDGTDTITGTATIKAVSFAIGLRNASYSESAFIYNDDFNILSEPTEADGGWIVDGIRLKSGIVYSGGKFIYDGTDNLYQPVYWENTAATALDSPGFDSQSNRVSMIEVAADGTVHIIVTGNSSDSSEYRYWVEGTGYLYDYDENYSAVTPWDSYHTTAIDEVNGNIYQWGFGETYDQQQNYSSGFFLAEDLTEIIHNTSFDPDPMNPESGFEPNGIFIEPLSSADSNVYIYGQYTDFDSPYKAGYTVNDGSWTNLPPMHTTTNDENIRYMSSTSDYILEVDNDGSYSYAVYINNTLYELEIPYEDNPDFQIFYLEYNYLEIVDGSVFVGGGYTLSDYDELTDDYTVAVIWRDGNIVYEGFDDDPEETSGYENASLAWEAFDFE